MRVVLTNENGFRHNHMIHRLVAIQFITPVPGKEFVNHRNRIKSDNRVRNLEWCTQKENSEHWRKGK